MKTLYLLIIIMTLCIVPITNLQAFANTVSGPVFAQNTTMNMHIQSTSTPFNLTPPQDRQIHLRFLDANNNQIKNMMFSIEITRENQQLLTSVFYSYSGSLTLNLQPSYSTSWSVYTDHDNMGCNDYSSPTDNITIYVPMPIRNGTYHFEIQPTLTHVSYGCYIPKSMGIKFETTLNLLDAYNKTITPQIIPEFPFAIPILAVSLISLIVFYRIRSKMKI